LNKKILSFIFGSLLMFSLFGAIEFQLVAAQTWGATVTSKTSGTTYFNSGSMPMNFDVKITYSSIDTAARLNQVQITAPANYVLESAGSQPTPPSGWSVDYINSTADGALAAATMAYSHGSGVYGSSTITFTVKLVSCTEADGTSSPWIISDGTSPVNLPNQLPNTTVDDTPPTFDLKYLKSPKVETGVAPFVDILGLGNLQIQLVASEPVAPTSSDKPIVKVKQINKTETTVTVNSQSGNYPDSVFLSSVSGYSITSTSGASDGLATVTVSAKDRAGNIGTLVNPATALGYDGPSFIVDSQCQAPALIDPTNGASLPSGAPIRMEWEKIPDSANINVTYTLEYSTSSSFSTKTTVAGPYNDLTDTFLGSGTGWAPTASTTRWYEVSLVPGTYYWRVRATDSLNNLSSYSAVRSFSVTSDDTIPPNYRVRFIKTPKIDYNTTPDVLGSGSLSIRIYASETLKKNPTVQVRLHNQTTWTSLSVTPTTAASIYTATYTVPTGTTNNGLAQISISGEDLQGNVGTDINASRWYGAHNTSPYPTSDLDSDGNTFLCRYSYRFTKFI